MGKEHSEEPIRLGISSCLLGLEVRYDGGHKRDALLIDTLGPFVEWKSVCPEHEAGFGTPREPMRLVHAEGDIRLLTVKTNRDVTNRLRDYAAARVAHLATLGLDGYVLKSGSPSCGLFGVDVFAHEGTDRRSGRGLFADALCTALPSLPVEEEARLRIPELREQFLRRVFAFHRQRTGRG